MSGEYALREDSVFDGAPIECFHFTSGSRSWFYTSADVPITLPLGTFSPETISRGDLAHSQEEISSEVEIHLPRVSEIVAPFVSFVPMNPISVGIWRAHRGDEVHAITIFLGVIGGCDFKGSEAILRCVPISQNFKRPIPNLLYQPTCNWAVFSDDCGLDRAAFMDQIIVTSSAGNDVVSNDFAQRPNGWYNSGYLKRASGDIRYVISHIGNTVTLMRAFDGLRSLERIEAYPGCGGTEEICRVKFSNLARHFGFSRIPLANPHEGRFI